MSIFFTEAKIHFSHLLTLSGSRRQVFSRRGICDFKQCGILTCVHSGEPVRPPFKIRNSE